MDWSSILSQTITQAIGVSAVIYCLAAVGLNVHFGYTGLLNFGQSAFLAVAAYGLAVSVSGMYPVFKFQAAIRYETELLADRFKF